MRNLIGRAVHQIFKRQAGGSLHDPHPVESSRRVLRELLHFAQNTDFGRHYEFEKLLDTTDPVRAFQEKVPVFTYDQMYGDWWSKIVEGAHNVCGPERISFLAMTSGTSLGSHKFVPVSPGMIRHTQGVTRALMAKMPELGISYDTFTRSVLSIGGTTSLDTINGMECGLFSGIVFGRTPAWARRLFKPKPSVYALKDWSAKVDHIVHNAPRWDIGAMYGFPCWMTPLADEIVRTHRLNSLLDIWPRLRVYGHAGMKMDPYRAHLEKLIGNGPVWIESYVASEGYFAVQLDPGSPAMRLITNRNIFYEFIPFDATGFDERGDPRPAAPVFRLEEVETDKEYAVLVTNNSGAWRYLIGDTLQFTSLDPPEIQITGRTALFINDCRERLTVSDLETAFAEACSRLGLEAVDFAVTSQKTGARVRHTWWVEADRLPPEMPEMLDGILQRINYDYAHVREDGILLPPGLQRLPPGSFHRYLEAGGRLNGQAKIPRVLKGKAAEQALGVWQREG